MECNMPGPSRSLNNPFQPSQKRSPSSWKYDICSKSLFSFEAQFFLQPENRHVKFDVDVKVDNDPDKLFELMHEIITAQPDWQSTLAPRIILGLWHPRFLAPAKAHLPFCRRSFIGYSVHNARKYFWNDCDTFSIGFAKLTNADGQK